MKTAADTLKRVHLELGGKAPFIVFDDADLELVAAKASLAATLNTGQDCTAATRLYVEKGKAGMVQEAVVEAMKNVKIGLPFEEGVQMGPLISGVHRERVSGFVDRAKSQGAKVLTGWWCPERVGKRLLLRADGINECATGLGDRSKRSLWTGIDGPGV